MAGLKVADATVASSSRSSSSVQGARDEQKAEFTESELLDFLGTLAEAIEA